MPELDDTLAHLRFQMSHGLPILFLGAGFSADARASSGEQLPSSYQLASMCWRLAFPDEEFDEGTTLGDAFHAAKSRDPKGLQELIKGRLQVDAESLPDYYATWLSAPWARCYSLNIDDLELAAARRFNLGRAVRAVSATSNSESERPTPGGLDVVHLNGFVADDLDDLTFSALDYGSRASRPEQWYIVCANELLTRPVVFVGTKLEEPLFWQYVELRLTKGPRGTHEVRPRSYLVSPSLNAAKRVLLRELNIEFVEMTASQFEEKVLRPASDANEEGHAAIRARTQTELRRSLPQVIGELASALREPSGDYLMGHEPTWNDIQQGLAIEREADAEAYRTATSMLKASDEAPPLVLTGTAGSGKSTSLMRLGLKLTADGVPVYWLDEQSNVEPHRLRDLVHNTTEPVAILVDDGDLFGGLLSGWARELPQIRSGVLFAAALRSAKVEGLLDVKTLSGI
ncbi:MAG: SIR2 family protein [Chloroflexi bacterium]|nr:SIR2 family protein [Chloroflexota bacterium]